MLTSTDEFRDSGWDPGWLVDIEKRTIKQLKASLYTDRVWKRVLESSKVPE